jgi:DNA-binding transcriptional regulator YiaG
MSSASTFDEKVATQIFCAQYGTVSNDEKISHPASREAQAERLRALRQTTGLSQQRFAEDLGLGYSQWANFESGTQRIGLDAALTVTRKLRVPLDWIYLGETAWLPSALKQAIDYALQNPAPRKPRRNTSAA